MIIYSNNLSAEKNVLRKVENVAINDETFLSDIIASSKIKKILLSDLL